MLEFEIARSTERSVEPGSAGHAPGKPVLTSSLSPTRAAQGAASVGATRAPDPFWFAGSHAAPNQMTMDLKICAEVRLTKESP
jgi:hypothetical protein